MDKNQIIEKVKDNINKIPISEFVSEGGFPVFDYLDLIIYNQREINGKTIVNADILYNLEFAGCCFIPGRSQQYPLRKQIIIENEQIQFLSYE